MNNEISKKTFVLSIIKLALTVVALILLLFVPVIDGTNGMHFIVASYSYVAGGINGIDGVIGLFGVIFWTPFIIVAVIVLVKTVLLFVAVMTQKTGKKLYAEPQWRKKFKCISIIPLSVLYFLALAIRLEGYSLKLFVPYLAIIYAIADGVICGMLKKSLGIGKQKKKIKEEEKQEQKVEQ